jgi:hypothetical protein
MRIDSSLRVEQALEIIRDQWLKDMKLESTDFNEFELHAYDDREKATSFLLKRLMNSLGLWREELMRENLSTREVEEIADCVRALKRPKIQVNS